MNRRTLLFASCLGSACFPAPEEEHEDTGAMPDGAIAQTVVGKEGGVVEGGGLRLDIPADALLEDVEITVHAADEASVAGVDMLSPHYRFEPDGLQFARSVAVRLELDGDQLGTLYWSRPDDPDRYDAIGLAVAGVAEGWTDHFSTAFVGGGACEDPNGAGASHCACRADDEIGDLLCPTMPEDNVCADIDGYAGQDGASCSGYAARSEMTYTCSCLSGDGDYLCPDAYVLGPMQQCPSEGGLNGFPAEEPMGSCSGSTLEFDPETMEAMNVGASGMLVDCSPVYADPEIESLSGTLEGCIADDPGAGDSAACGVGDEDDPASTPAPSGSCLARIDALEQTRTTACARPMGANDLWHANIGTEIGTLIETMRWADGATKLRQVKVPFGSKSECNDPPDERTSPGFLDLVELVSRDDAAKEVVIRIGEVKPMTRSGLTDGRRDLQCYHDRVNEAGAKCLDITQDSPAALAEYVDFCHFFDAFGMRVKLDEAQPYLSRQPALEEHVPHTFTTMPGGMVELTIMTCEAGIVAYQCEG